MTAQDPTASAPEPPPPTEPVEAQAPQAPNSAASRRRRWKLGLGVLAALAALGLGIPLGLHALRTVSTDDAYVSGHVTFVAPRVQGQVLRVLVDDDNRVKEGDLLVEIDPEPYRVQVAIKQAAVDSARAQVDVVRAAARSQLGQARSLRFKLQHAIEEVDDQVATLRARGAVLEQAQASLTLAQAEFGRAAKLRARKVMSAEEYDQKREALAVAQAGVTQALENVYQQRVALGLPREPPGGASLTSVPAHIDQTTAAVREALAQLLEAAAPLGVVPSSYNLTPRQIIDEFYRRDPGGDIDRIYAVLIKTAPALKQSQAKLEEAERDLDQARLDLRYCRITAAIDGVVTRRNVNPGDHVQVGQSLMAIRSLHDIWVDANFKETQLRELRIGQPVDLEVDMYGSRRSFKGRISGFTMGTGSTLSLLPPQNATGNFVKVVQRLPVRIDLIDYDPDTAPLFVGLSVEPTVYIRRKPTGPNAGKFLQGVLQASSASHP
jgi:membrane fusion protein (multidrug efflux system)